MIVLRTEPQTPIRWKCSVCGDEGVISNWEESLFDLRRQRLALADPVHEIVIGAEVAATLRELQFLDTDCERMIFAIRAHNDGAILEANHEPNRRRRQRLDAAFGALNAATQTPDGW